MRFLFAAYCMFNNQSGNSLIGVYKRCLRIGLELHRRGHEVAIICPGRGVFRDETVVAASKCMEFIDLPLQAYFHASPKYKRRCLRQAIREFAPDVIAVGEVPMRGVLLDVATAACELQIPCVILDNASGPSLAAKFVRDHSAIADGLALMGPGSFQMKSPPPFYCSVAPFIKPSTIAATRRLNEVWPSGRTVITVLGYERKAEELAISLMSTMPFLPCQLLLVTPNTSATEERLAALTKRVRDKFHIMPLPGEDVLFEALRRSSLVIGKFGFMQMIESICLRTPFLGIYYRGCFPAWGLSPRIRLSVGQTSSTKSTLAVRLRFLRLLYMGRRFMSKVEPGNGNGLTTICDFLQGVAGVLRAGVTDESARHGYTSERVLQALQARHPARSIEVLWVRSGPMRSSSDGVVDVVIAGYRSGYRKQIVVLWGRRFSNFISAQQVKAAALADASRRIWFEASDGLLLIEEEQGEDTLARV